MGLGAIAGVSLVGNLASTALGASSASSAASAQTAAANEAAQTQLSMYNQTRSDLAPYNTFGQSAFSQLGSLFGLGGSGTSTPNTAAMTTALENTPGYQFTLGQGTQALDRSAAAQGLDLSGAQLKDAQAYGQGLAESNAWAPYVSQLDSIASLGENAAAQTGNYATQTGAGVAKSQLDAGQSTASGIAGATNAINSGLSVLTGNGNGSISQLLSSYGVLGGSSSQLPSLDSANDGLGAIY